MSENEAKSLKHYEGTGNQQTSEGEKITKLLGQLRGPELDREGTRKAEGEDKREREKPRETEKRKRKPRENKRQREKPRENERNREEKKEKTEREDKRRTR